MTELTEKRAIAFIRTIAQKCSDCLRKLPENCRNCPAGWAKAIMDDYERDERAAASNRPEIDYSLMARQIMIARALEAKPLLASEIDLHDYCTPQLKRWTLLHMMQKGTVARRIVKSTSKTNRYQYFLVKTDSGK